MDNVAIMELFIRTMKKESVKNTFFFHKMPGPTGVVRNQSLSLWGQKRNRNIIMLSVIIE